MGSCLRARGRKILRSVLLKLFSHCLVFIVYQNSRRSSVPHHEALAGFFSTSFEGGRKSGGERGRLLEYSVGSSQTRPNNDSLS
jgi:hypothetical protein